MAQNPEFTAVFQDLRAILAEYEPKLKVVHDKPDNYYLDTFHVGANKRPVMQGKACFNFKTRDESLFEELKQITRNGYRAWKKLEWVE